MFLTRATAILPLLALLACGCGDQPSSSDADAGTPPPDAATEIPDDAGEGRDAGGQEDAGGLDAGSTDPGACEGEGSYPAADPAHAWSDVESLRDQPLRDALHERIKDHVSLGYNDARRAIRDTVDNHEGMLECIYTGMTRASATAFSNGMNIEHTWPQSEMGEFLGTGEADMHHLFPSDSDFNLQRSSWPFAYTECDARGDCHLSRGGSHIEIFRGETTTMVVEVRPERRGDVARAHFYFSVRYGLPIDSAEEAVLRCWNWSDPPDAQERARNGRVEAIQTNRNPFVDRSDFVEKIADF